MAKKQVGPTPITAKLMHSTKGGIVQPKIKNLQAPTKFINPASLTKRVTSGIMEAAKHRSNAQKGGYGGNLATGYGFLKGFLSGEYSGSAKSTSPKSTQPKSNKNSSPKKGTYDYAKAARPDLDNIISKRNKATKGSAEYNRYQNQINKAYGVGPTNRSTTEKVVAPKVKAQTAQVGPTASTTITPKAKKSTVKVDPKKAAKVENISRRADKSKAKSKAAAAAGNTKKAERLQKRATRQEARASRQADKAIEPKVNKKELRQTKRKLVKEQRAKFKAAKKEIKTYKDY